MVEALKSFYQRIALWLYYMMSRHSFASSVTENIYADSFFYALKFEKAQGCSFSHLLNAKENFARFYELNKYTPSLLRLSLSNFGKSTFSHDQLALSPDYQ